MHLRKTFLSLDVVESTNANLFLSRDENAFICIAGTGKSQKTE